MTERLKVLATRMNVAEWIATERREHADVKYGEGTEAKALVDKQFEDEGLGDDSLNFILNYLKRAELFGMHTPQGKQAMGKLIVTCTAYLERAVMLHGPMPKPGVPSGEIQEWHPTSS